MIFLGVSYLVLISVEKFDDFLEKISENLKYFLWIKKTQESEGIEG